MRKIVILFFALCIILCGCSRDKDVSDLSPKSNSSILTSSHNETSTFVNQDLDQTNIVGEWECFNCGISNGTDVYSCFDFNEDSSFKCSIGIYETDNGTTIYGTYTYSNNVLTLQFKKQYSDVDDPGTILNDVYAYDVIIKDTQKKSIVFVNHDEQPSWQGDKYIINHVFKKS